MDFELYGSNICPFSKKIRFVLDEIDVKYRLIDTKTWILNKQFLELNPANEIPVLKDKRNGYIICDSYLIMEYLSRLYSEKNEFSRHSFFGKNLEEFIEIQRIHMWFDKKFYNDTMVCFIEEIFYKTYQQSKVPLNTDRLRIARYNLDIHLRYIEFLLSNRKWLASEKFSIADIAAATQISILDYLGNINWRKYLKLKEWYIIIKSKKGFENILQDKIPGFQASLYYDKLDF